MNRVGENFCAVFWITASIPASQARLAKLAGSVAIVGPTPARWLTLHAVGKS
jgi:hypothetical protein